MVLGKLKLKDIYNIFMHNKYKIFMKEILFMNNCNLMMAQEPHKDLTFLT